MMEDSKYILNKEGKKVAIQIPIDIYEKLVADSEELYLIKGRKEKVTPDIWESLSWEQKDEIMDAMEELENSQTVDYEEVMKKHRK